MRVEERLPSGIGRQWLRENISRPLRSCAVTVPGEWRIRTALPDALRRTALLEPRHKTVQGPCPNAKSGGKADAEMRLRPYQPRRMGRIAPRFSQRNQGLPCKCASGRSPDLRIAGPERLPAREHHGQWLRILRTLPSLHAYSYGVVADLHRASRTPEATWIVSQACVRPTQL